MLLTGGERAITPSHTILAQSSGIGMDRCVVCSVKAAPISLGTELGGACAARSTVEELLQFAAYERPPAYLPNSDSSPKQASRLHATTTPTIQFQPFRPNGKMPSP